MTDDRISHIVGTTSANTFILEHLLAKMFLELPKPQRLKFAESLLDSSEQATHFEGVAKGDEIRAMRLSDAIIVMRETVDHMVGVALKISEEAEGSGF